MTSSENPTTTTSDEEHPTKRKWRRIHGLQRPWHPQQVISWLILAFFILYTFFAIIPNFHSKAQLALYIVHVILYSTHLVTHAVAELLDPADPNLRALTSKKPVPEFDRNKHAHVIENGRCHLCNITISSQRTKHCSVCNKCVDVFDHHCKWLNQCIGSRNYKWFAWSVITAILMSLIFMSLAFTMIGLYYSDSLTNLHPWEEDGLMSNSTVDNNNNNNNNNGSAVDNGGEFHIFFCPVSSSAFMGLTFSAVFVALVAFVLLLHLTLFHIYINYVGITTYEYVRAARMGLDQHQVNPPQSTPEIQQEQTVDSRCCQLVCCRNKKISPAAPNAAQPAASGNGHANGHQNGRQKM
jgi:hypothetical protein